MIAGKMWRNEIIGPCRLASEMNRGRVGVKNFLFAQRIQGMRDES